MDREGRKGRPRHSLELKTMNINIALKDLDLSRLNVRKAQPTADEQAELMASIFTHGLLENLVVRVTESDRYEVLAGGRRLMAMQRLARDGEMEPDHPVACLVHDGDPQEVSLAENIVRLSMHALDQFEAFAALADKGLSVTEIANRFGNAEALVRQRLRLGRVAPEIREAYRDDNINLDTLMAFAVTEDHGQQMTVWEDVKNGHVHAHYVRRLLTDEKIAANSKYVQFIGMEAYEAAARSGLGQAAWPRMIPKTGCGRALARIYSFSSPISAHSVLFADGTADCSDDRNPCQAVGLEDNGLSSTASQQPRQQAVKSRARLSNTNGLKAVASGRGRGTTSSRAWRSYQHS